MGNRNTKSSLRTAIIYLNISADSVKANDEKFWSQIWSEEASEAADIIRGISTQEIRMLRDGSSENFATLTYKMVERLCIATGTLCNTNSQQTAVLNATRILTRLIPCIFEDKLWRNFFSENQLHSADSDNLELIYPKKADQNRDFKSYLPSGSQAFSLLDEEVEEDETEKLKSNKKEFNLLSDCNSNESITIAESDSESKTNKLYDNSLMRSLLFSICDLLFCPEFTVSPHSAGFSHSSVDTPPEDIRSLATCDYVWEPGVGFDSDINSTRYYDKSRSELLRLLLACISGTLYETPSSSMKNRNTWLEILTSPSNRQTLPLFTSLLNTVFIYNPSKLLPFNHLLFIDPREELVELSIQILIATSDHRATNEDEETRADSKDNEERNMFVEYMSRIHREADFLFLIKGFQRLLNSRIEKGYLLSSMKHINFDQELLILLWNFCNLNKKFMTYLLNTTDTLDIVVPILYHLNENFQNTTKTALIHVGVFDLLILSGERNFGVRLNKPYLTNILSNIPTFTGSHADLMIIVIHKLILYGQNLNQLYDFLLTIVVNISPYLKTLSLLACKCLIQLFEIFSSPFVIFTEPHYHQVVIYLLEIFNNLIQYQFDGNAQLVCSMISKSDAFITLANLPCTQQGIKKVLNKLVKKKEQIKSLVTSTDENQNHQVDNVQYTDFDLRAKISSNQQESQHYSQSHKLEVSLAATPDIFHVTQTILPFVRGAAQRQQVSSDQDVKVPSISFDDLLDQEELNQEEYCPDIEQAASNVCTEKEAPTESDKVDSNLNESNKTHSIRSEDSTEKWSLSPLWVKQWKEALPLQTILRMIDVLKPQLERLNREGQHNGVELIKFVQSGTLVGLLPVPHPIVIRKYRINSATTLWFKTCIWGAIYVRNSIWTGTSIRLVKIIVQ